MTAPVADAGFRDALRLFLDLAGTPGEAAGEDAGPDAFVAIATWR